MLLIVRDENGEILDVLSVKNFDEEFHDRMKEAEREWHSTTEDFNSFVYGKLRDYGYELAVMRRQSDWDIYCSNF